MPKFSAAALTLFVTLTPMAFAQGPVGTPIASKVSLADYNRIFKGVITRPEVTMFDYSDSERWLLRSSSLETDHIQVSYFKEGQYTAYYDASITVETASQPELAKPKLVDLTTYNHLLSDVAKGYTMSNIGDETVYLMGFADEDAYLKLYDFSAPAQPYQVLAQP